MGDEVNEKVRAFLGGGPRALAAGILAGFGARLGRQPSPGDVAALLAVWDDVRAIFARHAGVASGPPKQAREAKALCPGSHQLVLSTATSPFVCPFCSGLVGRARRLSGGQRQLAKHAPASAVGDAPGPAKARPSREKEGAR